MTKRKTKPKQVRASGGRVGKQPAKRSAATKQATTSRGQIGPRTYEAVRKIVVEKKIPVGKAFEEVAKATGRQPGTVAVTYYRIARLKGGPTRKRRAGTAGRRPVGRPRGTGSGAKAGGIGPLLSRVSAAIKELETVIAHQAEEIARLRGESKLADRIRKALRE